MMFQVEILYKGEIKISVLKKIRESGKEDCQVLEFLDSRPSKEKAKARALITFVGDRGINIRNTTKVEKIKGKKFCNFYELKPKPLRIFGFYQDENKELILVKAILKKKNRLPVGFYETLYTEYRRILDELI
jgi:hypothetical protein